MKVKKIGIVSLSSGIMGEDFVKHELEIGINRLKEYGVEVEFLPHALKGLGYIKEHPEKRAEDLLAAFQDDSVDMILCAIGGDDTYRLLPYLFENEELKKAVKQKIFLGFSDTTMNHFMLNKVGIKTFYGQAFLPDVCELSDEMLPYTKHYFEELINTGTIKEIRPSDVWYQERTDFRVYRYGTYSKKHSAAGGKKTKTERRKITEEFGRNRDDAGAVTCGANVVSVVEEIKKQKSESPTLYRKLALF